MTSELSLKYPILSNFHLFGEKNVKISKGDIVVRGASWSHGNQDGGPGSKGLVYDILKYGSEIWVYWHNNAAANYVPNQLKVVGRVPEICIGDIVTRGPDWNEGDQDGGADNPGLVMQFRDQGCQVIVLWRSTRARANYRWGNAFDVSIIPGASQMLFFMDACAGDLPEAINMCKAHYLASGVEPVSGSLEEYQAMYSKEKGTVPGSPTVAASTLPGNVPVNHTNYGF